MHINEKIQMAIEYVAHHEGTQDFKSLRNDAANIYAESFEDYQSIWDALQKT